MAQNTLLAGFHRADITPPLGTHLGGYYTERPADTVLDPLYVNALAFSDGQTTAVILVCDLLGIYSPVAYRWPEQIADRLGIDHDNVFLCSTHTHTGPVIDGKRDPSNPMYDAWLPCILGDAAKVALQDLKPVTGIFAGEDSFPGSAYVRRFLMKNGRVARWNKAMADEFLGAACDADESMRVVRFDRENASPLVLVNCQNHADTIGGCGISADWPGVLRRVMEEELAGAHCVLINGAEGQLVSRDQCAPQKVKGYAHTQRFGRLMASFALELCGKLSPIEGSDVKCLRGFVSAPTKRDASRVPEAERIIALHEAGRDDEIEPFYDRVGIVAESYRFRTLEQEKIDEIVLRVSTMQIGPLALVGFPGEPYCEIGQQTRAASAYPMTFIACQANGSEGYFPMAEAYDQGGYETYNTPLKKGAAEKLIATAIETLQKLAAK